MTEPVQAVAKHRGRELRLRFEACRIAMGGEFAGNVDVDVACAAAARETVAEQLSVRLPGASETGPALGTGPFSSGVTCGFWCEALLTRPELPSEVVLLWEGEPIARIAPTLHESRPIEEVARWTPPSEVSGARPVETGSSRVLLAAPRERSGYLLAAALLGVALLGAIVVTAFELPWTASLPGGVLLALGCAFAIRRARTPYRQVWLDRDRGRVLVIEGRRRPVGDAPGRELGEFAHVRLWMRWSISHDPQFDDQESWSVALEGPIRWAGSDGRVHLRPDGVLLGGFRSGEEARRLAADVGALTGLPILDTAHDGTA